MEQPPVKVIHAKSGTTSADIPIGLPVIEAVFINDEGEPTGYQPEFALEFDENIGDAIANVAAAAAEPPTQAEFNALVTAYNDLATQFNQLIEKMASAGILQRPNNGD